LWEQWTTQLDLFGRPWPPNSNPSISLAHGYASAPLYFLSSTVLGVRPLAPGFTKIAISPYTGGLSSAQGAVPVPQGRVVVSWTNSTAGTFTLQTWVPSGTSATISVPMGPRNQVTAGGQTIWNNGPVANTTGVQALGLTNN